MKKDKINQIITIIRKRIFLIIIFCFAVWITFISDYSLMAYSKLKKEEQELKEVDRYYKERIKENRQSVNIFNDDKYLEQFAREKYLMKRDNEDVFLFEEEDTLQ